MGARTKRILFTVFVFGLAALIVAASAEGQSSVPYGDWAYVPHADRMTDEAADFGFVQSDTEGGFTFGVKCMDAEPNVLLLVTDRSMRIDLIDASADYAPPIRYRFDQDPPQTGGGTSWRWNDDKYVMATPATPAMLRDVRNSRELAVRLFDYDGQVIGTYTFSLNGTIRVLDRLSCVDRSSYEATFQS